MNRAEIEAMVRDVENGALMLPVHLREGFAQWCHRARPVGGFINAVLENDLRDAVARADPVSLAALKTCCQFLYGYAPGKAHGSPEKVKAWAALGGLEGMLKEEADGA